LPFTQYFFANSDINGNDLYTLEFNLEVSEEVVFSRYIDEFKAELPEDLLSVFEMDMPYFHISDFKLMHKLLPSEFQKDFKSIFIDDYEAGMSIMIFVSYY
jgi:hypothetical protein